MNDYGLTQALYKVLLGNEVLMEAVNGIYTHVPEGETAPYLSFQIMEVNEGSFLPSRPRVSLKLQLEFYSQYRGVVELQGVMGEISRQLNGLNLDLNWKDKRGTACFRGVSQRQDIMGDDLTRKGSLTYQCLIQF